MSMTIGDDDYDHSPDVDDDPDDYDDRLMPPAQEEPDGDEQAAQEYEEHCEEVHGGADCDCPLEPLPEAGPGVIYSDEPPF